MVCRRGSHGPLDLEKSFSRGHQLLHLSNPFLLIDICRRKLLPTTNPLSLRLCKLFPQLVAGPLKGHQLCCPKSLRDAILIIRKGSVGCGLLWGMFKKVVVADTCAIYVNDVFANYTEYSGGHS